MSDESQGEKPKRLPQWAQDEIFDKLTQPIEAERKQRAEDQLARGRALASAEDASFSSFTLPRWYATDKERELDREAAEVRACFFLVGFLAIAFGLGTLGFGITFIFSFVIAPFVWVPLIGKRLPQYSSLNRAFWYSWLLILSIIFMSI